MKLYLIVLFSLCFIANDLQAASKRDLAPNSAESLTNLLINPGYNHETIHHALVNARHTSRLPVLTIVIALNDAINILRDDPGLSFVCDPSRIVDLKNVRDGLVNGLVRGICQPVEHPDSKSGN